MILRLARIQTFPEERISEKTGEKKQLKLEKVIKHVPETRINLKNMPAVSDEPLEVVSNIYNRRSQG